MAERFVLTLNSWLLTQAWQSVAEMETLLAVFMPDCHISLYLKQME